MNVSDSCRQHSDAQIGDLFAFVVLPHIDKAGKKGKRAKRIIALAMKNEKVRNQLKKDLGDEWAKLEASVKGKATELAKESPSWIGTKVKGARESIGGWFGKFKEAAGIEDTAEESKEGEEPPNVLPIPVPK